MDRTRIRTDPTPAGPATDDPVDDEGSFVAVAGGQTASGYAQGLVSVVIVYAFVRLAGLVRRVLRRCRRRRLRRPDGSGGGGRGLLDGRRQRVEQRIGPRPGRAVVAADRTVAGRLDPQRQPEDLDEPDRRGVVERVALVVRRQALVVERQRRAPPDDDRRAVVEPDPGVAADDPLG